MSEPNQNPSAENVATTQHGPDEGASSARSEKPQPVSPAQSGVSLIAVIVVATLMSAFGSFVTWSFISSGKGGAQPVVMVDGAKLVEIQAKTALAKPGMTAELAAKEGKDFVVRLNNALDEYTQAGVVVVNSSVVLNRPTQLDVTAQIAQKLGLKME